MRDLDLLATGPVVREASRVFDDFWNSAAAVPVENVAKVSATPAAMRRAAGELRRGFRPKEDDWPLRVDEAAVGARVASLPRVLVPAQAELLHDGIGSFRGKDRGHMLVSRLENELRTAEQSLDVEAAYFVLRRRDVAAGEVMLKRNVKVRVVTNSLASTNQPAAHSGHANRRREFLRTGAGLYEFRPRSEAGLRQVADGRDGARTGIHTKAMVIDGRKSFVGSFNLDPRSANINTEVGLLVESGEVSRQVGEFLEEATWPGNAWRVTLDERGREVWRDWDGGEERFWRHEPQTSLPERIRCRFFRLLPIESLL
jgi:putative cardiolipin synthase